jgi:hypothetical protein
MQINQDNSVNAWNANPDCPICWGSITSTDQKIITTCNHLFHQKCLTRWVQDYSDTCPLCRGVRPIFFALPEPLTANSNCCRIAELIHLLFVASLGVYLLLVICSRGYEGVS